MSKRLIRFPNPIVNEGKEVDCVCISYISRKLKDDITILRHILSHVLPLIRKETISFKRRRISFRVFNLMKSEAKKAEIQSVKSSFTKSQVQTIKYSTKSIGK
jgi:hypothetical protein